MAVTEEQDEAEHEGVVTLSIFAAGLRWRRRRLPERGAPARPRPRAPARAAPCKRAPAGPSARLRSPRRSGACGGARGRESVQGSRAARRSRAAPRAPSRTAPPHPSLCPASARRPRGGSGCGRLGEARGRSVPALARPREPGAAAAAPSRQRPARPGAPGPGALHGGVTGTRRWRCPPSAPGARPPARRQPTSRPACPRQRACRWLGCPAHGRRACGAAAHRAGKAEEGTR